jgi:hypothetical protein
MSVACDGLKDIETLSTPSINSATEKKGKLSSENRDNSISPVDGVRDRKGGAEGGGGRKR